MMTQRCEVAVVGSGFAGSLIARVLATLGYSVALIERGAHPRFAIGESSTPLANLTLERLAARYGLDDCYELATHGRWLASRPQLMRGLKRGFTYYRHHAGEPFAAHAAPERLVVAASPDDAIADTHWLRAEVDHHLVREAIAAGVDYREQVELTSASVASDGVMLRGRTRDGGSIAFDAGFVVDATGPGGFLARQLAIPSALEHTNTRSALVFSHFDGVGLMGERFPQLPNAPYPEDWAAVHHIIDEGWMYSLRFDDGVTSAGFLLSPQGAASLSLDGGRIDATALWRRLAERYPTIGDLFADASPRFPIACIPRIQHRLTRAVGDRWVLLPHAYGFVDPLFSTGIAWGLRGVERLADAFSQAAGGSRVPSEHALARYEALLAAEADQVDRLVAGAYEAMSHFDLFAAHSMLYFSTVSYAEVSQRFAPDEPWAWSGFLGVGDPVCDTLFAESLRRLRELAPSASPDARRGYADWVAEAIGPRNIAGLADSSRQNVYPVDLDVLVDRHALLGLSREQIVERLPLLRGGVPQPG